jgi:hypothetical protein
VPKQLRDADHALATTEQCICLDPLCFEWVLGFEKSDLLSKELPGNLEPILLLGKGSFGSVSLAWDSHRG